MSGLSEDDSSDSSNEFLVAPKKINFNSSFFTEKNSKVNTVAVKTDTEEESTDDECLRDVSQASSIELFTQVLKNLESSQKLHQPDENAEKHQSGDSPASHDKKKLIPEIKEERRHSTSPNEINELLLRGESSAGSPRKMDLEETPVGNEDDEEGNTEYIIPKDGVKITLPGTSLMLNRKKKGAVDLKALLRRRLRANQVFIEKVGLLCWLAYGFYLNRQANQPEVMSTGLSLISSTSYPKTRIDLAYLEKFTKWFRNVFTVDPAESDGNEHINNESLLKALEERKISDYRELVLLYVATLRGLGLNCRLVVSLGPPHRALSDDPLFQTDKKERDNPKGKSNAAKGRASSKSRKRDASDKPTVIQNSPEAKRNANMEAKKRAAEILLSKSKKSKSNAKKDSATSEAAESSSAAGKRDEGKGVSGQRQLRPRRVNAASGENETEKAAESNSRSDGKKSKYYMEEDSTDSEAEFHPKVTRAAKRQSSEKAASSKSNKKSNRELLSSESESEETGKPRKTKDIWVEVFLESEESWICVSVMDEKIHCVKEVYKSAKKPVLHVIAWNSEGLVKDVTRRYCPHWLTVTRKQRVDEKWWSEALAPWKEESTAISRAEDEMLLQKELEQPLPKSLAECKGHPLYVVARHLLKFEGLYPPDCVPLGYLKTGDAIYSRHCVHTLCSRETWLKRARVVKPDQEPYKIVKARPKYDKLSGMKIKDLPLEVFGEWQTKQYEPPEAKDGIVPRNEYGNVDLFQQCMLPKGTVHVNLPGLYRVARKLNIDCASAVVGFNFGGMGAVPALEGFVVCAEYEDTLREAWEAEQVEAMKRAKEKRDKRVYGNWKRLIHGLIIRERLVAKYEFSEEIKTVATKKRAKHKKTDAKKTRVS